MKLLNLPSDTDRHNLASLPFSLVVCGLRSAWRTRVSAHWGQLGGQLAHDSPAASRSGQHCLNAVLGAISTLQLRAARNSSSQATARLTGERFPQPSTHHRRSSARSGEHPCGRVEARRVVVHITVFLRVIDSAWMHSRRACVAPVPRWPSGGSPLHCSACQPSPAFRP